MNKIYSIILLFASLPAWAISVTPMELYGTEDELVSKVIRVVNHSKYDEFVRVNIYKILEPATPNQREVDIDNATSLVMSVYPRRFKVASGTSKEVRLLLPSSDVQSEQLYRIRFVPVASFEEGVTIKVSYGTLVRVLPKTERPAVKHSLDDEGNSRFTNVGNIRLTVKSSCESDKLSEFRLYPGLGFDIGDDCDKSDYKFLHKKNEISY
ncbi:hypothetical protein [Ferrimonas balearica]|uniref:hypothetical protein n=1 Tax=Ferrimonas balearica TaxID=44012 RepID=UPI001C98F48C|nr:hypothetical protein [Ferrimonas balearica]MBY5921064.1 hypothetical protein [Ferrimonas balearica]MBY5996251.1 hypothetical protein [Ferrimonas balearica]